MSLPRVSGSGTLILLIYVLAIQYLFDKSVYGDLFRSDDMMSSSIILNSLSMSASFLNVASHSAVVLGALNDTYVLSIIIGVGFDVMARLFYLIWWIDITRVSSRRSDGTVKLFSDIYTFGFLCVSSITYTYHMIMHIMALRLDRSYESLINLLTAALNNLRGIPGERFHDHIFAYSDLGGHMLPFVLSLSVLKMQNALLAATQVFIIMTITFGLILIRIPLNKVHDEIPLLRIESDGKIACQCDVCMTRSSRKNKKCAFTLNHHDGICHLWLHSFEQLYHKLQDTMKKQT